LAFIIRTYHDARSSECQIIFDICDGIANEDVPCRVQCVLFTIYVILFFVEKYGKMLPLQ